MSALHVVGFDQSLTSFGIAAIHGSETTVRRLRYPARKPSQDVRAYQHQRLDYLADGIRSAASGAHVAALEDMTFGAKGDALTDLAGLFWLVRHELWKLRVPYVIINSSHRRKWMTGNGGADKDEVLACAIKAFPQADIRNNDEADALIMAAMTAEHYGCPMAQMPAASTALLSAVHSRKTTKIQALWGQPMIDWPVIERSAA